MMQLETLKSEVNTADWDRDVTSPIWSADSKRVYFLSDDRGSTSVHVMDRKGSRTQVTSGVHRLSNLKLAGEELVAMYTTPTVPPSLVRISGGVVHPIVDANRDIGCRFTPAEEIWYSSFDHTKIQGWVMKPPGFDPSKRYPMVVVIHGGPHGAYGAAFSDEFQTLVSRGYVVLFTNPRGSTGYGEAFANVIQHKWPGDDIKGLLNNNMYN